MLRAQRDTKLIQIEYVVVIMLTWTVINCLHEWITLWLISRLVQLTANLYMYTDAKVCLMSVKVTFWHQNCCLTCVVIISVPLKTPCSWQLEFQVSFVMIEQETLCTLNVNFPNNKLHFEQISSLIVCL